MALIRTCLNQWNPKLAYIFTDWRMWVNLFDVAESSGYGVRNMIVWDKGTPGMGVGWRSQHELVLCGVKVSRPFNPHKAQGNVIQSTRTGNPNHPTEKPVDLMETLIGVNDMAEHVLDTFSGSGTTFIAAHRQGRQCYGLELSDAYASVILTRCEAEGLTCELLERQEGTCTSR
jgi:DNA modification methylase